MAAEAKEAYMLPRDLRESQRLDAQHEYMREMSHGHLIHPAIPASQLYTVADVATGTGIWLRQLAEDPTLPRPVDHHKPSFVGFDISQQQLPPTESLPSYVSFVVHDMVEPFPTEYHERFDLVNVRLVSYAVKGSDLDKVLRNIIQLLRKQQPETDSEL